MIFAFSFLCQPCVDRDFYAEIRFWKFPLAIAPMAQWLARMNVEQRCAGSNPARSTAGYKFYCTWFSILLLRYFRETTFIAIFLTFLNLFSWPQ
jgi:hypothetical protein